MEFKNFLLIILTIIGLFLLLGVANTVYGADLDVVRDFDNVTVYHTVKSDSGSQTVWGIENNAKLMSKNGNLLSNGIYEDDNGRYEYDGMYLNDNLLDRNDRVYFKEPVLLTASYKFIPFCNAKIVVNDPQGNADRYATFPKMTKEADSLTQIFADPVDFDKSSYEFINIIDTETNETYQPGDKYTITYNDCVLSGGNITKVFEYVYKEIPKFNASITIVDPVGNTDGYVDFPNMSPNDSLTHTFKEPVDVDNVHYDFWYIVDETGSIYLQPGDSYTITYDDCLAVNDGINKVFTYTYGYFPDYTVTYISINNETGIIFDDVTETVNRENWSAFYTLPDAPEVEHKILDYVLIVEDGITNYVPGNTYEAMFDMCLSEGSNLTRTFIYFYKEGEYANVTVNYIFNIDNELNNTIFHREYFPYLVVGDEAVGGYVDYHIDVAGYNFTGVTFQEIITNDVKGMLPGSNIRDEGGFWVYEVNETGNIDLNFMYNYVPIKVDPTPEPTPTPAPGNDTDDNGTDPVDPTPEPTPVPPTPAPGNNTEDNSTIPVNPTPVPITPVDNKVVNNNTNSTNVTAKAVSNDSNIITMPETGKNPWIAVFVLIIFILVFVFGYYVDNKKE